jgi:hypothetical protein
MDIRSSVLMLFPLLLLATGCKKEPGEGGKAEIQGVVMRQEVNAAGAPIGDPYPYKETRVYIIYGDGDYSDDDTRTGPDGGYSFRWLRKGEYTVYVFGEQCKDCPDDMVAIKQTVTIDDKKGVVTVPVMTALNF